MAGFKTHITTSSLIGVGYTGVGLFMGLPIESSLIAGGMCGIGGMLPDIDSDSGIPFRESMGFAAAIIPILLLSRFSDLGLNFEQMVLVCSSMYLLVRFGLARCCDLHRLCLVDVVVHGNVERTVGLLLDFHAEEAMVLGLVD